jgi:ATP-binding cassette subfamily B protein
MEGRRNLTVLKYLFKSKRTVITLIIIVGFLALQAVCDLLLPNYTSDIVDIGIMQGGIENAVPQEIRKQSLSDLELFMPDADADAVSKAYREGKDGETYVLKGSAASKESTEKLDKIFSVPMAMLAGGEMKADNAGSGQPGTDANGAGFGQPGTDAEDAGSGQPGIDIAKLRAGYAAGAVTKAQLLDIREEAEKEIRS